MGQNLECNLSEIRRGFIFGLVPHLVQKTVSGGTELSKDAFK